LLEIGSLRPDWFGDWRRGPKKSSTKRKEHILDIASKGHDKPKGKIGGSLHQYTYANGSTYDKEFDEKIRFLRPDWFKRKQKKEK
jgi:hypothetical protein